MNAATLREQQNHAFRMGRARRPAPGLSELPGLYPEGETVLAYLKGEIDILATTLGVEIPAPTGLYPHGVTEVSYLRSCCETLAAAAGIALDSLPALYPSGASELSVFIDILLQIETATGGGGGGGGGGTPGQPLNLVVSTVSDTELNLTWDLADDNDTAITVERSNDGSTGWVTVGTLAGGWRTWTDRSLIPSTTRHYRVTALVDEGEGPVLSDPSDPASATTAADGSTAGNALTSPSATADTAWQITFGWTSPSISGDPKVIIERSTDAGATFTIREVVNAVAGAQTYVDTPLSPSTSYVYRARAANGSTYGPYTANQSATTPAKTSGFPSVPAAFGIAVLSDVQTDVFWTDTNAGGATYQIETAAVPGSGSPLSATFSLAHETSAGDEEYFMATTAETPVYVRVRAKQGGHNSAYTPILLIRPASHTDGSTIHEIGAGKTYTTLGALDWSILKPGDTVKVYSGTYAEKIAITSRGHEGGGNITIQGVDNGGGLPIITGLEATTDSQFSIGHTFEDLALVHFGKRLAQANGHQAGYIIFENFVLQAAYQNNSPATYTAADAGTRSYVQGAAGIYFGRADNIHILNCEITNCSNGIFGAADGSDVRDLADVLIENCYLHGNGTPAGFSEHNIYMEGARTTYLGNRIAALRATSGGSCLKDRGPGLVVKANWIEGAARLLDIVETQNGITRFLKDPAYGISYVWGNVFKNAGEASIPIHYGGDSSGDWYYRKGYLFFSHNTFANKFNAATQFRVHWFFVSSPSGVCIPTNNIFWVEKATGPGSRPEVDLFADDTGNVDATGLFGVNFVTPGWHTAQVGITFVGKAAGTAAFVSPDLNLPGFTAEGSDYSPGGGAAVIGLGSRLPADHPVVNRQYHVDQDTDARSSYGTGADLGAYQS